jgi:16S rRNA (cytosine967-C5)-methyltransferase
MSDVDLLRCALPEPSPKLAGFSRRPFIREAALEALAAARKRPSHATLALAHYFRSTRRLGSRDRRTVQEAVYGVVRHEGILLRAGMHADADLLDGWARLMEGETFPDIAPGRPAEDLASALSVGYRLAAGWLERLGPEEAAQLARALQGRPAVHLRANRLRCDRAALAERLADEGLQTTPIPDTPDGLALVGRANLQASPAFREGWFEVQDASSQRLCAAIPLARGQRVVDVCAGAGGKSLALAARGARVSAWDIRDDALRELDKRARRAGAEIAIEEPAPAPVVLVDAPCSSTGRLARDPALRWGLEQDRHVATQAELLHAAAGLVEPGGVLVYATCSLVEAEQAHEPPPGEAGWTLEQDVVLWPHRSGTDGFSWRVWRRGGVG